MHAAKYRHYQQELKQAADKQMQDLEYVAHASGDGHDDEVKMSVDDLPDIAVDMEDGDETPGLDLTGSGNAKMQSKEAGHYTD